MVSSNLTIFRDLIGNVSVPYLQGSYLRTIRRSQDRYSFDKFFDILRELNQIFEQEKIPYYLAVRENRLWFKRRTCSLCSTILSWVWFIDPVSDRAVMRILGLLLREGILSTDLVPDINAYLHLHSSNIRVFISKTEVINTFRLDIGYSIWSIEYRD